MTLMVRVTESLCKHTIVPNNLDLPDHQPDRVAAFKG